MFLYDIFKLTVNIFNFNSKLKLNISLTEGII